MESQLTGLCTGTILWCSMVYWKVNHLPQRMGAVLLFLSVSGTYHECKKMYAIPDRKGKRQVLYNSVYSCNTDGLCHAFCKKGRCMVKKLLVIYDLDLAYGNELLSQMMSRRGFPFEVKLVTSYKSLSEIQEEITLLLLDEALVGIELGQNVRQTLYLSENRSDETHLNRYQSVEQLLEHIQIVCKACVEIEQKKISETRIIAVYSPLGGCGKTTLANGLVQSVTQRGGQAYYLDFGLISERYSSSDVDFYYDLHMHELFKEKNWDNYFVKEEGGRFLKSSLYGISLWNVEQEDILYLVQGIRERNERACYVFDVGFINQSVLRLLEECDCWLMPCGESTEREKRVEHVKELVRFEEKEVIISKILEVSRKEQMEDVMKKLGL